MKPLIGFKKFLNKFWIRKDREIYLLSGVMITTTISAFVSSYWHFSDRMEVSSKININLHMEMDKKKEFTRFKEAASYSNEPKTGDKQYYKLEEIPAMTMPGLYEEDPASSNEPADAEPSDNSAEENSTEYQETDEEN
ncbi:MAG: hypothetical protein L6420_10250 [Elusimicrobia bacterium]|nr:hypothetical protein [Elusimicrobiota bacterium]